MKLYFTLLFRLGEGNRSSGRGERRQNISSRLNSWGGKILLSRGGKKIGREKLREGRKRAERRHLLSRILLCEGGKGGSCAISTRGRPKEVCLKEKGGKG